MKKSNKRKAPADEEEEVTETRPSKGKEKEKEKENGSAAKKPKGGKRLIPRGQAVDCFSTEGPYDPASPPDASELRFTLASGSVQHHNITFVHKGEKEGVYHRLWWDTETKKPIQFKPDFFKDPNPSTQRRTDPTYTVKYPLNKTVKHDADLIDTIKYIDGSNIDHLASEDAVQAWENAGINPLPGRDEIASCYVSPLSTTDDTLFDLRLRFKVDPKTGFRYSVYKKDDPDATHEYPIEPKHIYAGDCITSTFRTDTMFIRKVDRARINAMEENGRKKPLGRFTVGMEANVVEMHVEPGEAQQVIDRN